MERAHTTHIEIACSVSGYSVVWWTTRGAVVVAESPDFAAIERRAEQWAHGEQAPLVRRMH
jgi:hypothetical protein